MGQANPALLSLAHLTVLDASPPELVSLADHAGCAFVGLRLIPVTPEETPWPLIADKRLMRETKGALSDTGVRVLDVELVRLTPEIEVVALEPLLAAAAEIGARHVLTQVHDPDLARARGRYCDLCELAKPYGLSCDIEFLTWTGMRDMAAASAFIRETGHSQAGLCIDTLHFCRSGCAIDDIRETPPAWLHFAQVSDAPALAPPTNDGLIAAAREDRLWPGEGELPLLALIERLPPGIPLALEIPNRTLARRMSADARVRGAAAAMRRLLCEDRGALGHTQWAS